MVRSCEIDERYGRWTPLNEAPRKGKAKQRAFNCLCDCGNEKVVLLNDLRRGKSISCGCARIDAISTHGECKTRLYNCWHGMICRSNDRDDCEVFPEWRTSFIAFKKWSLANGYTDDKILCRNGDVGDYEPGNVRWDTHQSNLEESFAKHFKMISPDGDVVDIYNLNKFSDENGLNSSCMHRVYRGERKSHQGWKKFIGE